MQDGFERYVALINHGEEIHAMLALVTLCSARMLAAMMVLPPTSSSALQSMTRNGVVIWLGLFIAWGQPLDVVRDISLPMLGALLLKETLLGLLIGFAAATIFWTAEGVGSMIDNLAGYNNVQQKNPLSDDQSTPVGNLLAQLANFAFYSLGGMMAFVGIIFGSYRWWPLNQPLPKTPQLLERFAELQVSNYIASVARIAAPMLLTLLLIDIGFGLLTKAAEKLEPSGMSQPVKGAVTMVMLSLLISVFFHEVQDQFSLRGFEQALMAFFQIGK